VSDLRTRRLEPADEPAFNEAFCRFIRTRYHRRPRSLEHMRWIWHGAPGGDAESWIVEAREASQWKIVGHHGLCPIRFTCGDEDWLCAKTMRTFLMPEYRDRFLYLRFEQERLADAAQRFDALYSTAPGTARLRSALGYQNFGPWLWLERGLQPLHLLPRIISSLLGKYSPGARRHFCRALAAMTQPPERTSSRDLVEYTSSEALASSFFASFWTEARQTAGMAPRRDPADLAWTFWQRPGFTCSTLTCSWPGGACAYFIVDSSNPLAFHLLDFYVFPQRPDLLAEALEALFFWCATRGALSLGFHTTADGLPPELLRVFSCRMKPFALSRFFPKGDMPRRLLAAGTRRTGARLSPWNVTEILAADQI
jgi:hypothetical protein